MTITPLNDDLRAAWFGKVSPDWKLGRAKNAFRVVSKKVGERSSEYDLLSLTLKGIILRDIDSGKGKFPESFDTYQEVKKGDIVFCLFDVDETPRTVGLSDMDGMVTGAYTVVRCTKLADPRYVTYFYLSIDERKGLRPFYTGLRKVVRTETFLNAAFPLPDLATQRQIADFLDRETARIDLLIEKKQQLVALLREKRSTTITEAVTTGGAVGSALGADGATYWDESVQSSLRPLKHCCHVNPTVLPETTDPDWEFDYIDIGSVSLSEGVTHRERMRFAASPSRARKPVREGDILVSTVRTYLKAIAAVELADTPQVASTGFAVLRAYKGTDARFLYRVVQSNPFVEQVASQSTGVSYPAINPSTLSNIEVPLTDLATQRQIADFLDRETSRIDVIQGKTNKSIERLKEYRSTLITAAVTGQIDVETYAKSGTPDCRLNAIQEEMGA